MRIYEDFTRCDCGYAYLLKETYVLVAYTKGIQNNTANFRELPEKRETRYVCGNCKQIIFVQRE